MHKNILEQHKMKNKVLDVREGLKVFSLQQGRAVHCIGFLTAKAKTLVNNLAKNLVKILWVQRMNIYCGLQIFRTEICFNSLVPVRSHVNSRCFFSR